MPVEQCRLVAIAPVSIVWHIWGQSVVSAPGIVPVAARVLVFPYMVAL